MDVINGVREAFIDEGMDEQVLLELKQVVNDFNFCFIFLYSALEIFLGSVLILSNLWKNKLVKQKVKVLHGTQVQAGIPESHIWSAHC